MFVVRFASMRCSTDIRKRVIAFVRGGGSKAEAAHRFQVSRASVYNWLEAPDALSYQRPGPRKATKLDWEALRRHVENHSDKTQKERARHFGVSRHCIWNALHKMGLTRKKNDVLQGAQSYEKKRVSASS